MLIRVTEQQHLRPGAARFEFDSPRWESDLSADDQVYAAAVRERSAGWEDVPFETFTDLWEDDDDRTGVIACLHLPVIGLVGAAHVQGDLHCGPVHPHVTHFFGPWSPSLEYDGHGSPEALAQQACEWFETLMRRPAVLWLWHTEQLGSAAPACYAGRYEFADNGDLVAEWFDPLRAPEAETARAREGGYFIESAVGSWLTTETLAHPDAFVFVRGDRPAARIPDGCRELPSVHAVERGYDIRVLDSDLRWDTRRARDRGLRRR
jgi:hypothetical protein